MSEENPLITRQETNWALCCLCQQKTNQDLRCPYKTERHLKAYQTLEEDLKAFTESNVPLLFGVTLESLNDGSGIARTLEKNKAKYHHLCRGRFRSHILQRAQDKRPREESSSEVTTFTPKKNRSSFNASLDREKPQCVYCEKYHEPLYRARSENCGKNLHKWALESKNWVVYARLNTASDAEAGDISYHASCYTKLKNDARSEERKSEAKKTPMQYDPLVIAHLVAYVQYNESTFKLADLRKLYECRLEQLGSDWIGHFVHQTRFKDHLLEKLGPEWSTFSEGRDVFISHKKTVGAAVAQTSCLQVTEDEAKKIVEVGLLLRRYVLLQQMPFNGSFPPTCLSEPVAKPLQTLLDVLLQGSGSVEEKLEENQASINARVKVACTISQLICSNAAKRTSQVCTLYQRKERETPFPLYVGLKLHGNDRNKGIINKFHALGMSVSYDRVMDVRRDLALAVSRQFEADGVVVPSNMKRGVFTTGGVDNIDESGRFELHGTAITLTNHLTHGNMGVDPPPLTLEASGGTTIKLPDNFAIVPYIAEYAGEIKLSSIPDGTARPDFTENNRAGVPEEAWLDHIHMVLKEKDGILQDTPVTYSGFFSHGQPKEDVRPRATVGVFPVFYEKASSMAMQKHSMLVVMKATEFVNPGQVPVIVADCPLYAQQKKCQWKFPNEVGESKMVCFMGFLHIEMMSQECGGKLLAGSGWDAMFSLAKICNTGVAASLLGGKQVKRTRHAYQLTLAWIHVLKVQAYDEYCQEGYGPHETMEMWEDRLKTNAPTISYWLTVRDYLMINCRLIRGQRVGNWPLTLKTCEDLCPWLFAFGHTNYARWMPIFLKDMARLPETHPSVHQAFTEGKFVVQRGDKKFTLMALDQSQEHSIKFLKEDSGSKGLYGQHEEKEIIELSKPEVLRAIDEFELACFSGSSNKENMEHPESSAAEQKKFLKDLNALCDLVKYDKVVNPFKETGTELITLDTGEVMDHETMNGLTYFLI